jgi:hypothetical protein
VIRAALALALSIVTAAAAAQPPTPRWTPLRPHLQQSRYAHSTARFNVVPAGRRSGKTEVAKRKLIRRALQPPVHFPGRYFAAAPVYMQAKRIYWADLKALIPKPLIASISESELVIRLKNFTELHVFGMDKPARAEGSPWDGGILDEYGNMKADVWDAHVRPSLADRNGWCDLIGVPEGRNHYYDRYMRALADTTGEWAGFTWKSADILPKAEIDAARADMDSLVFEQEYEASFVNFVGRAYYAFDHERHVAPLKYDADRPLVFCFDFNVAPGVAVVCQEQQLPVRSSSGAWSRPKNAAMGTGVVGEVWIPRGSNTEMVCRRLLQDWGGHRGQVQAYGDATGGAEHTSSSDGSDVEIVERELRAVFRDRVTMRFQKSNPSERARVNAVNTRLLTGSGEVHLLIDGERAPHVVSDLGGVRTVEGGSGELDKKTDPTLTHISDALGYYVAEAFPISPLSTAFWEMNL